MLPGHTNAMTFVDQFLEKEELAVPFQVLLFTIQ
jgi:hypothetical protein